MIIKFISSAKFLMIISFGILCSNPRRHLEEKVPIYFSEYGVEIRSINELGDTLIYNKSMKESFLFVFYDFKGKCHCERFINGKLLQKGNYANSLDTLKRYVSGRSLNGETSPIRVQKYFEPLKTGEWISYKNGKQLKEHYRLGILLTTPATH
jgi:hypothetical protein